MCYQTEEYMPPDPTETIKKILASAKAEFLQKGYGGASLRKIAARAGLTTGALYRHYADKESLYRALVEPVYHEFLDSLRGQTDYYDSLLATEGLNAMWERSGRSVEALFRYIYDHLDEFKLLLSAEKRTVYGDFREQLIRSDVELTMRYIQSARQRKYTTRDFTSEELYVIVLGQYSGFFEIVLQNDEMEKAIQYARLYSIFCNAGWKALLEG
jgi:AcrR family transcriptional regulator